MAQTNYTPISLYYSTTASQAPLAANLVNGELAINITDGKLYYKDNGGVVKVLAGSGGTGIVAGSNTQIQFNNSGVFGASSSLTWDGTYLTAGSIKDSALTSGRVTYAGASGLLQDSANLTFNGTTLTANTLNLTNALTTSYGGTGLTSFTAGDLPYYATGTALSKLGIGTAGNYLSSSGTAPQWSSPAALTKTDDTNVTLTLGGSASTALLNAASLTLGWTGQLSVARGGTNATATPTAGAVAYGTGTAYAFTSAGTSNQVLISNGASAPSWSSLSSLSVTSLSFGTTGLTPATATQGAITVAGTLATTNGGTGLTSFTANGVVYASSTSALTTGSALTFDGTEFKVNAASGNVLVQPSNVANAKLYMRHGSIANNNGFEVDSSSNTIFLQAGSEAMRLTSTGLGIGTSSPVQKLHVDGRIAVSGSGYTVSSTNGLIGAYNGNMYVQMPSGGNLQIWKSTTDAVAIFDQSGNLGLGVTPNTSWQSTWTALQVGPGISIATLKSNSGNQALEIGSNYYVNAGYKYQASSTATRYEQDGGVHSWYNAPSGTAGNAITFTQAMTLDASGQLVIGSTTANAQLEVYKLNDTGFSGIRVNNPSSGASSAIEMGIDFYNATNYHGRISAFRSNNEFRINNNQAGALTFYTSNTERARIDSSGNLLVGVTSGDRHWLSKSNAGGYAVTLNNSNANPFGTQIYHNTDSNGVGNPFLDCQGATNVRAQIRSNGGLANYSANDVNLSDRREKTNFAPAKSYLDTICAIPVQTFNYIDQSENDPGLTLGVVAQDVQAVAPELVSESNWGTEEDPKMRLSIYQTDLQYALMKCIQELKAEVDSLKAQLAAK